MSNNDLLIALRLQLLAHGFRSVRSASKRPAVNQWQQVCAAAGEAETRQRATTHPGCTNIGILCAGLACVDINVPEPDVVQAPRQARPETLL